MVDTRELILSRLELLLNVEGIVSVARNALDLPLLQRPGMILQDGSEERLSAPEGAIYSEIQQMQLTPQIWLYLRGTSAQSGPLMSLFRGRVLYAIFSDDVLRGICSTQGMRYEGCSVVEPTPETKEPRMDINIVFSYTMKLSDFFVAPEGVVSS